MEKLIKLKNIYKQKVENATYKAGGSFYEINGSEMVNAYYQGQSVAFSEFIEQLDLILNNSVVKPSERRSPTDETFSGCKPPDERQNPQEEKSECTKEYHIRCKKANHHICPRCYAFT